MGADLGMRKIPGGVWIVVRKLSVEGWPCCQWSSHARGRNGTAVTKKLFIGCIYPAAVTVCLGKVERWPQTAPVAALRHGPVLEKWCRQISKAGRPGGKLENPPPFSSFCTAGFQTTVESAEGSVESLAPCATVADSRSTSFQQQTAYPKFAHGASETRKSAGGIRPGGEPGSLWELWNFCARHSRRR